MAVDVTISLEDKVCKELKEFKPDCIVSDSICFWGKLYAQKLNVPLICSTTTFAFNEHTAKMMKQGLGEIMRMILGLRRVNKKMELLRLKGYKIKNLISLMQNDNDTNTIVYTSKEFQPMSETFSDKYFFIGPSVAKVTVMPKKNRRKQIYISLGTLNNKNIDFYKNCISAFENLDVHVVMSVGKDTVIDDLGEIPNNFEVKNSVEQVKVLQNMDVFITHCGMNSVNESLYYGVPMVLFPQHSEQRMVADRVINIGSGLMLKYNKVNHIKDTTLKVMNSNKYKESAEKISESFINAGGEKKAVDSILKVINSNS